MQPSENHTMYFIDDHGQRHQIAPLAESTWLDIRAYEELITDPVDFDCDFVFLPQCYAYGLKHEGCRPHRRPKHGGRLAKLIRKKPKQSNMDERGKWMKILSMLFREGK